MTTGPAQTPSALRRALLGAAVCALVAMAFVPCTRGRGYVSIFAMSPQYQINGAQLMLNITFATLAGAVIAYMSSTLIAAVIAHKRSILWGIAVAAAAVVAWAVYGVVADQRVKNFFAGGGTAVADKKQQPDEWDKFFAEQGAQPVYNPRSQQPDYSGEQATEQQVRDYQPPGD